MARNIGMEQNLVVGKISCMSSNFIPSIFNTYIKITLNALHFNIEAHLLNRMIIIMRPSSCKFLRSIDSTNDSADLAYEGLVGN